MATIKQVADLDWEPFLTTPPVPEYPSGHAALGKAASIVLAHFFGNNSPFSTTSTTASPAGAERSFKVLSKLLMKTPIQELWQEFTSASPMMRGRSWEIK